MSTLREILDGKNPGGIRNADKYTWTPLYSAAAIRHEVTGLKELGSVTIEGDYRFGYCSDLQETHEAIEFEGGKILVCATVTEFAGTFASHNDIAIKFFVLVPRP